MRLLFVHDRFGAQAGAESNAWHTASALKRRGHAVGLLHGPGTGQGEAAWDALFEPHAALDPLEPASSVRSAVASFRPDVVYLHNLPDQTAIQALLETGVPLVRMVHDHQLYCMRSYKYHTLSRRVCTRPLSAYCVFPCGASVVRDRSGGFPLRWVGYWKRKRDLALHRRFTRLIVASRYMADELERNGFDPRRIELHPPVPPPAEEAAQGAFSPRNLIVYAGQITRGKGVDVLLESLAQVRTPFECAILGDGHHRPYCEKLCRELGLADRVRFHGYVPQAEIEIRYREASLAVMSSVWPEPFGASGLEAMRHGLPVIAFDAGAIKEWLEDGESGFLVPWMDRAGFAERVDQLLRDKTLARQMGEHARRVVTQRYDFSRYIDGLEQLFARSAVETKTLAFV